MATRSEAQRSYEHLARLEGRLNAALDDVPYQILGDGPEQSRTCSALRQAAEKLAEVVGLVEQVRDEEGPRYLRSGLADRAA